MRPTLPLALTLVVLFAGTGSAGDKPVRLPVPEEFLTSLDTSYYGVYIQKNKVGWGKMEMGRGEHNGKPALITRTHIRFDMQALGDTKTMVVEEEQVYAIEPPHRLMAASSSEAQGPFVKKQSLREEPSGFVADIVEGGQKRALSIGKLDLNFMDMTTPVAWFRKPRKAGDTLRARSFSMSDLRPDVTRFHVTRIAKTDVAGISVTWYEADQRSEGDGDESKSRIDSQGRMLWYEVGNMFEIRLEPKRVAQAASKDFDVFMSMMARIDKPLGDAKEVEALTVRIHGPNVRHVPNGPRQTATWDADTGVLTLRTGKKNGTPCPVTDEERKEALAEDSDHPVKNETVQALAKQAVGDATTDRERVNRLVAFVSDYIADSYAAEPLSVLDIIEVKKGDCTEHTDLFTTLARAAGIPARRVGGYAYMGDGPKAFGGHAWNEVAIDGHWVPIDATWNQTEVDGTHIMESAGEAPIQSQMSLGGAKIELVEVVHAKKEAVPAGR